MVKIPKVKSGIPGKFAIVIIVLIAFMIAGLALGGWNFSKDVFKNFMFGVLIGGVAKVILMVFVKVAKPKGKTGKFIGKLKG